jgi:outer membrane protein assembly factor BamB
MGAHPSSSTRRHRRVRRGAALFCVALLASMIALAAPAAAGTRAPGDQLWASTLRAGFAYAEAVSPDGSKVFVTGESGSTVAYDAGTGARIWGAFHSNATFYAAAVSPDGGTVYVLGEALKKVNYLTVAYDAATGAKLWQNTYNGPDNDSDLPTEIGVTNDGSKVFVTGESWSNDTSFDFATIGYDAATGTQLWVARYDGNGGYDDPHDLVVSPDSGFVYVVGESPGNVYNDYATVAYDANTGEQRWVARYNSGGTRGDTPYAMGISPDGSAVFVTGCSGDFDYCVNSYVVTIAYDSGTGEQLWLATFKGPGGRNAYGRDLAVSPDGSTVFITGGAGGATSEDAAVVAYEAASGTQVWSAAYRGPGNENDYPCCIAASPDGSQVFITGDTAVDWATVSFDAQSGARQWATIYDDPGHSIDEAYALAVSPDSSAVYVSGTSASHGYEFTTVAYGA